ncbi:hypothetical protein E2C01_086340 [Portunus trituberculatus]|uniref:Uncharacterized protein n=1 Tax=Portunus trituberculatus TaxID=210409 RepID=A0A5B7JA17_PORTR|nr:hypothetical protein [Portunus trituberculatus]
MHLLWRKVFVVDGMTLLAFSHYHRLEPRQGSLLLCRSCPGCWHEAMVIGLQELKMNTNN